MLGVEDDELHSALADLLEAQTVASVRAEALQVIVMELLRCHPDPRHVATQFELAQRAAEGRLLASATSDGAVELAMRGWLLVRQEIGEILAERGLGAPPPPE